MRLYFDARFGVQHPYKRDLLPGERVGSFLFFGMGADPDRPQLRNVRAGVELKVFRGALALRIGCESETDAIATAMEECLNVDHKLPGFIHEVNQLNSFYRWEVTGDIDTPISQPIKSQGNVWVVDVTCSMVSKFGVQKDEAGQHVPIGT
jgi:hypothetical protein